MKKPDDGETRCSAVLCAEPAILNPVSHLDHLLFGSSKPVAQHAAFQLYEWTAKLLCIRMTI